MLTGVTPSQSIDKRPLGSVAPCRCCSTSRPTRRAGSTYGQGQTGSVRTARPSTCSEWNAAAGVKLLGQTIHPQQQPPPPRPQHQRRHQLPQQQPHPHHPPHHGQTSARLATSPAPGNAVARPAPPPPPIPTPTPTEATASTTAARKPQTPTVSPPLLRQTQVSALAHQPASASARHSACSLSQRE